MLKPKDELGDLDDGVAKMPALIERPEPQHEMRRRGGIKREIDDRNSPPPDVKTKPSFHGVV